MFSSDHYKMEVWRTLSMNDGVKTLFSLSKSQDHSIAQLASLVISTLQLEGMKIIIIIIKRSRKKKRKEKAKRKSEKKN